MPIQTVIQRNALCAAYGAAATHGAVYSTVPTSTAGTEPTGGSPAYARKALTWSAPAASSTNVSATFDIPSGFTAAGAGLHDALTGGNYRDGNALPANQAFASQGTLAVTYTYTQT